jgi:WhiB family redox-sensing transcriptional regulator
MAVVHPTWADEAACRGVEGVLFFSPLVVELKDARLARERRAKAICQQCPVREECLETALSQRESYGIWGGLNEMERRALLRR